ncbi:MULTISPECIES: hypothetical protein [Chryseobacterium group]|jgi:hypothetical protein|uniref:Lipoprotein n=4 Tax=Chryseobacterium TaxID=59732 RepID=A0AAJ1VK82_9FLAO|nr:MULTISPECIES: hypothetical protein [Chryseobacterium group]MBN9337977.1 hypothetical protein [Chryseobacterium sp.]OJX29539.1 MAG: hypothetical protein BGO86_14330 [Chryseobacterium sp. 36-9]EFK33203.1 hypothetical protein HMPREF0204_12271 [Chryseobacterium gleum ATCC 35910]MDN4013293.1 hypothetical protein [Chryseobacterium gambrini]MDN4028853.1 hypothetical protein [Chryseobacterium gambrini]
MKKVIPFLILIVGLCAQSCRQVDEQVDNDFALSRVAKESNKTSDSTRMKIELEKDPPVKDGQDWKH